MGRLGIDIKLVNDLAPVLGGSLDANGFPISNIGALGNTIGASRFDLVAGYTILGAGALTIKTASADLTLDPGSGVTVFPNNTGVVIGHPSQLTVIGGLAQFQVHGTGGDDSSILLSAHSTTNAVQSTVVFLKSGDATIGPASFTTVASGERLGAILWSADDGVDYATLGAQIRVEVEGTVAENRIPTIMKFFTGTNAAPSVVTNWWSINSAGTLLASNSPKIDLASAGSIENIALSGSNWDGSGIVLMGGDFVAKASVDSAAVVDEVAFGRYEIGAGNTVIALSQETIVVVETDETKVSHKMQIRINGASYYMVLMAT